MKRESLFKFLAVALICVLALIGIFLFKVSFVVDQWKGGNPLFSSEMNAAQFSEKRFVVGDLGGVPVRIPNYFANYVEYDGDPGFGEKRKVSVSERTYQTRLRSFGFKVRFPDMVGRSTRELSDDYSKGDHSISPWLSIGLTSGERYYHSGYLDRVVAAKLRFNAEEEGHPVLAHDNYAKLEVSEYELTVYAPPGIDPKNNKPYRQHEYASDLFVHRDENGRVDAYILCGNRNMPNLKWSPCTQSLSLEPDMAAAVTVNYSRNMLPHWKQIQEKTKQLILSFKASESLEKTNTKTSNLLR